MRKYLTYDDVNIIPKYSEVKSREDIDLSTRFTKNTTMSMPIVSSPMDTVTEYKMASEMLDRGGVGVISVTANIAPKLCSDMQKFSKSSLDNELKEAQKIDKILQPVHKSLFIESNPAPVKYAAKLLGLCSDEIRLPLVNIKKDTEEVVKKALKSAKLI